MTINLSQTDLESVPQAIEAAETKTRAEIFAVLAERSDDYRFVAYSFLALWIFLISGVLVLWLSWQGLIWQGWMIPNGGWNGDPQAGQDGVFGSRFLAAFVFGQVAALLTGIFMFRLFPSLAVAITPRRIADERARANGIRQFLAHGIHNTAGRTGLLVFISLDERYGEIFVDTAIEEAVGRDFFLDQVRVLVEHCAKGEITDAYVQVITAIGDRLAADFPVLDGDEDELENRFIIL